MIANLIVNISAVLSIAPVIVGAQKYRYHTKGLRILFYFLTLSMLFSIAGIVLLNFKINNMLLYNVFTPIEYSFLSYTLSFWQPNRLLRKMSVISIPIFIILILLLKIQFEDISQFDYISTTLEALLLICFSISALYGLLISKKVSLWKEPSFFAIFAILFYFAGNSMLFSYSSIITPFLWVSIHTSVGIISKISYTWSYYCLKNK